jgi:hypothetical protein
MGKFCEFCGNPTPNGICTCEQYVKTYGGNQQSNARVVSNVANGTANGIPTATATTTLTTYAQPQIQVPTYTQPYMKIPTYFQANPQAYVQQVTAPTTSVPTNPTEFVNNLKEKGTELVSNAQTTIKTETENGGVMALVKNHIKVVVILCVVLVLLVVFVANVLGGSNGKEKNLITNTISYIITKDDKYYDEIVNYSPKTASPGALNIFSSLNIPEDLSSVINEVNFKIKDIKIQDSSESEYSESPAAQDYGAESHLKSIYGISSDKIAGYKYFTCTIKCSNKINYAVSGYMIEYTDGKSFSEFIDTGSIEISVTK